MNSLLKFVYKCASDFLPELRFDRVLSQVLVYPLHHLSQMLEHHLALRESLLIQEPDLLLLRSAPCLQSTVLEVQLLEVIIVVLLYVGL